MGSTKIKSVTAKSEKKQKQITSILYQLQMIMEDFNNDINSSYELHKIGTKTKLTKSIELAINKHPLDNLSEISANIDNQCISILNSIAKQYFLKEKGIIKDVYKTNDNRQLHYAIVLKEDNEENRNRIFDFFDIKQINSVITKYPMYFQFTTEDTINRIKSNTSIERISL